MKYYLFLMSCFFLPFLVKGQTYPVPTKLEIVDYTQPSSNLMPPYLETFMDASFGGSVIRISDKNVFRTEGTNLRHNYAKDQPWNANGSLLKLAGYPAAILDGNTFEFLYWLNPPSGEFFWSHTEPLIIYGIHQDNNFVRQNVETGAMETIRTFSSSSKVLLGRFEGNFSNDDRYFPFLIKNGNSYRVESYDRLEDKIIGNLELGDNQPDWVSFSQSGAFLVIQWNKEGSGNSRGVKVYDKNLNFQRHLIDETPHGDLGYDMSGNEVFVYYDSADDGGIKSIDLATGEIMVQIENGPGLWGGHISCRNTDRPGYAYISEIGSPNQGNGQLAFREIFALRLDGSGMVERFCHHHSDAQQGYYHQPHGVPNQDGTKVLFASNWTRDDFEIPPSFITTFENIISSDYEVTNEKISEVQPNPFKGNLIISNIDSYDSLRIVSMMGTLIHEQAIDSDKLEIDLSRLSSGMYYLLLMDSINKVIETQKVIKQ